MLSINCPELCTNPERPPHGRAGGNPAPSRRESGPEPTEILPRFRSPPPLLKTYLTHFPFGSEASLPPSLQPTYILEDGRQQYDIPMPAEVSNPTQVLPKTCRPYNPPRNPPFRHPFQRFWLPFWPLSDRLFEPFRSALWHPLGIPP